MVHPALLPLMRTPRLPVVDRTDAPADLNEHVCFAERRNLFSARVPSHFKRSLRDVQYDRDSCLLFQQNLSVNCFWRFVNARRWIVSWASLIQPNIYMVYNDSEGARGGVVAKALCYKPVGRGFDSQWCHWNFSVTILPVALWPWGRLSL
jgi:hypothetical protein